MKKLIVAPSVLSADFSNMQSEINCVNDSGAPWVHLDVMDGYFVPNISFGQKFIKDLRKHSKLFFDAHLMINNPLRFIKDFAESGCDAITVHLEACNNPIEVIELIHSFNLKAGISICPDTDVTAIKDILDIVDIVLIMSVNPGVGGQKFMLSSVDKIKYLYNERKNRKYLISVDGGINEDTIKKVVDAGTDIVVTGSAFFKAIDKSDFVSRLSCLK